MIISSFNSLLLLLTLTTSTLASPVHSSPPIDLDSPTGRTARIKQKTPKYFDEPGLSLALSHYDIRFFKAEVPYDEHRVVLRDLIRSYLTTFHDHGVETWLAHGTLLGWWWNGQIMPWDYDLDVQVSNATMQWLGDNMNRTEHIHNFTSPDGTSRSKTYLLDINPHHVDLDRGDGQNIIDGRWIDTDNGMFIDITALRERENYKPGTWSCKNRHRYTSQDLWPMRITEFESVKARIPYNFEKALTDEYGMKCLVLEEYQGHKFDHDIKEWVRMDGNDVEKSRAEAIERKKQELLKQGRLNQ